MNEERNKDEDMERFKKELKELIDHRIEYNNGFANLLHGNYSLFISLITLFLSVYGAWRLGFLAKYYVLSVYLMFIIWLLYGIERTIRAPKEIKQEGVIKPTSINLEKIKVSLNWYLEWAKPIFYSLGTLFLLCILVLCIIEEKRWWMWAPAILFVIFLPLIAEKGNQWFTALLDFIKQKHKIEVSTIRVIVAIILLILIFAIIGYSYYNILKELIFVVLETPYSLPHIILTVILISVSFASLSEYLSMKFMVTDLSNQDYDLFMQRALIDRIEDAKTLEKHKKELLKLYLPKADSFLVFFNYYYLMFTEYTFEVGEGDEEELNIN